MKILAIDTSTNVASCAIMDDEKLLGEFTVNDNITHSQKILPLISNTLSRCKIDISEIDVFAVADGPGSYTGLRIGVATINGLAQATHKQVVGVSSLQALAQSIVTSEKLIVPLINARRDRAFTAIYSAKDSFKTILEPQLLEMVELLEILDKKNQDIIFIGEGTTIYKDMIIEKLGERAYFTPKSLNVAKASSVAEISLEKVKLGETKTYFDLTPNYLRETQAQREYDEKMEKKL